MEYGKDVIFDHQDPLSHLRHYALVIKGGRLTGSVNSANSLRAACHQILQGLDTPFLDIDGKEVSTDGVYLVTVWPMSQQALASVKGVIGGSGKAMRIIDGPALLDLIDKYRPDITWSLPKDLPRIPHDPPKSSIDLSNIDARFRIPIGTGHRPKQAFVLMPFCDPYDRYYPAVYKPGLEAAGYIVKRGDDLSLPQPIIRDIQGSIVDADLILSDLSGRNPNVFYELGLAHAIGKPVILVCDKIDDVPFDLRHIRVITYDYRAPDWAPKLRDDICASARSVDAQKDETWPPPLIPPRNW